jgi:uncharacterized membrane protein
VTDFTPQQGAGTWESLAPWDKAAQWYGNAPELADEVMALAKQHAAHQWEMEKAEALHRRRMDIRVWMTQVIGMFLGLANVAVLAAVAWHYADTGNVVPGLTTFGAGTAVTAGVLLTGRAVGSRLGSESPTGRKRGRKSAP